jgi:hypothetical protein
MGLRMGRLRMILLSVNVLRDHAAGSRSRFSSYVGYLIIMKNWSWMSRGRMMKFRCGERYVAGF